MKTRIADNKVAAELVSRASDDFVHLLEAAWVTRKITKLQDAEAVMRTTLEAIALCLDEDLLRVAQFDSSRKLVDWPEDNAGALRRIEREWRAIEALEVGAICWLRTTPKGDAIGRTIQPAQWEDDD